uniref:Uncharacterized protein n=1 Tax=Rhizophora mucronata TaxID=61149 RepID=A0A2P2QBY3_RHIMU
MEMQDPKAIKIIRRSLWKHFDNVNHGSQKPGYIFNNNKHRDHHDMQDVS